MQAKDIKRLVTKQLKKGLLKKGFPDWRRLPKKRKKELSAQVLKEVASGYPSDGWKSVPISESTGTPVELKVIIPLSKMGAFVESKTRGIMIYPRCRHRSICRAMRS